MRSRSVLVTGAGGRIGRRLAALLVRRGHRVVAAGRHVDDIEGCETVAGDLLRQDACDAAMAVLCAKDGAPPVVIHLAGIADASAARASPGLAFRVNVQLVQQLLDSAVKHGVERLMLASTGLVYGRCGDVSAAEHMPPNPGSLYAATKAAAEAILQGYAGEGLVRGEIMRLSNVYGPDSPEATVVGRLLAQARRGEAIAVASRAPVRDFLFIDDALEAICALLEHETDAACCISNVSSGAGVSIGQLADTVAHLVHGAAPAAAEEAAPDDRLVLANAVIEKRLGWRPRHGLLDGLRASLAAAPSN